MRRREAAVWAASFHFAAFQRANVRSAIFMFMQEARDLPPQFARLQQLANRSSTPEEFPLQLRWNRVPLHDNCGPETAKNVPLFFIEVLVITTAVLVRRAYGFVEIARQPLVIVGEFSVAVLQPLKLTDGARFLSACGQPPVFCSFLSKLLGSEHMCFLALGRTLLGVAPMKRHDNRYVGTQQSNSEAIRRFG